MKFTAFNSGAAGRPRPDASIPLCGTHTHFGKTILKFAMAAASCAVMFAATQAAAQQPLCAKRHVMKGHLARTYTILPFTIHVGGTDNVVEVLISLNDGNRKFLVTAPNGTSCIVDAKRKLPPSAPRPAVQIPNWTPAGVL